MKGGVTSKSHHWMIEQLQTEFEHLQSKAQDGQEILCRQEAEKEIN